MALIKRGGRYDADMTKGSIVRQLLAFALPMMLGMLFQQLYNTVDTIVVGQFVGKEALAAVGSTGNIVNMLVGLFNGLSIGAGVVISQHYGAHDDDKLSEAVQTTMLLTFLLAVIATAVGILIVRPMLYLMNTPDDVFEDAVIYLRIYFAGISGLMVYNMCSGILRSVGDSRRPLYFLIFSAICNIIGDLTFVIFFDLGVAGVAYATILSQFLSAALELIVLTRTDASYRIIWAKLRIHRDPLKKIFSIGLPSGIQQAITSFSNVFVQGYINAFGSACMAGWSVYNKVDIYVIIPVQAISAASSTFVGQNYGARQLGRARKGARTSILISLAITAVLILVVLPTAPYLLHLFTQDEDVIEFGTYFVRVISWFYLLTVFNQIFAGALRGIGIAKAPTVCMLGSFVVFRQIYLYVTKQLGGGLLAVALAYPMGWILCSLLMAILYFRSAIGKAKLSGGPDENAPAPEASV